jgi:hypothetical protein
MDVRAIGWSGILQITAFAGASFYSLGPGLGKRGRRGIFGPNGRVAAGGSALRTTNLFFAPARTANGGCRHLRLQQQQQTMAEPRDRKFC